MTTTQVVHYGVKSKPYQQRNPIFERSENTPLPLNGNKDAQVGFTALSASMTSLFVVTLTAEDPTSTAHGRKNTHLRGKVTTLS